MIYSKIFILKNEVFNFNWYSIIHQQQNLWGTNLANELRNSLDRLKSGRKYIYFKKLLNGRIRITRNLTFITKHAG